MSGVITITGVSAGEPLGERIFSPVSVVGKAVIAETLAIELETGINTFKVPRESVAVYILMPTNGEAATKFKTSLNSSDTGLPLNPGPQPFFYVFPEVAPTSITLTAASSTGVVSIAFI